jgi:hypothetical protein
LPDAPTLAVEALTFGAAAAGSRGAGADGTFAAAGAGAGAALAAGTRSVVKHCAHRTSCPA